MRSMMRRCVIVATMVMAMVQGMRAQQLSESYLRENPSWVDAELWTDEGEYRYMPQTLYAPFEQYAQWGFLFVTNAFRGEARSSLAVRLGAVEVAEPLERYPDYTFINQLRRIPSRRTNLWSNAHTERGAEVRSEVLEVSPSLLDERSRLRVQLSSHNYLLGTTFASAGTLGKGWYYSLMVGGRWGRDSHIEGLFTDEEQVWLSAERVWGEVVRRRLQVGFMVAPTMRSERSWNTEEVFTLADNKYYNSYWGWQGGEVRSSRVRRECVPTLYTAYDMRNGYLLSNINITTLLRAGTESASRMGWADAPNPLPDYYGYLPSGQSDDLVAVAAREGWLRGDESLTQVDWQGLYNANLLNPTESHYALFDERREKVSAVVDGSAAVVGSSHLRLGLRAAYHSSHNYNEVADLLGGESLVGGFDFYDYTVSHTSWRLYGTYNTSHEWGRVAAAAEFGGAECRYRSSGSGYKASYDGVVATLKGQYDYSWGKNGKVGAVVRYACEPAYWEDVFGSAEGAVWENPYSGLQHEGSVEVWGEVALGRLRLYSTLFVRQEEGVSMAESLWGDLHEGYVTLLAGGVGRQTYGGELSLSMPLAKSLDATLHTTLLAVRYAHNGVADVVDYNSGRVLATDLTLLLDGKVATSAPQAAAAFVLRYRTTAGWVCGAEWEVVAQRYVTPSLYLSSSEVLGRNLTPEVRKAIEEPQSLGSASSFNLYIYRKMGAFALSLSVRNLLNDTGAYYDGYQPSRLLVRESEYAMDYKLHDARFRYIYPRYMVANVTYEF